MKSKFFVVLLLSMFALSSATVFASPSDRKTYFHTDDAFMIPGAKLVDGVNLLESGSTYVFKLFESPSSRTIVLIYNGDETRYLGLVMGIPTYRTHVTDDSEFIFERAEKGGMYLKKWYFAGEEMGVEFVGGLNIGY